MWVKPRKKNNILHIVFGNFSDSSTAIHLGRLQVLEPVSTANHSAPTEIKPQTPEARTASAECREWPWRKKEGHVSQQDKGKEEMDLLVGRWIFKKGLYQDPAARGKHALEPRFRNIQINSIHCSWRPERTGRKVNFSPPSCLGAGKAEISQNYSESLMEF